MSAWQCQHPTVVPRREEDLFQLPQELWVACAADQMQLVSSNDQTLNIHDTTMRLTVDQLHASESMHGANPVAEIHHSVHILYKVSGMYKAQSHIVHIQLKFNIL